MLELLLRRLLQIRIRQLEELMLRRLPEIRPQVLPRPALLLRRLRLKLEDPHLPETLEELPRILEQVILLLEQLMLRTLVTPQVLLQEET
jgi:hypothetical protein